MMKKTILLLLCFALTSCIDVDEFNTPFVGAHVVKDTSMVGHWRSVSDPKSLKHSPSYSIDITEKDRVFTVAMGGHANKGTAYNSANFWVLRFERSLFLFWPQRHFLSKLQLAGNDKFTIYELNIQKAADYLKVHYPKSQNVFVDNTDKWKGHAIKVISLNEEAGKILGELSNHDEFWVQVYQFERGGNDPPIAHAYHPKKQSQLAAPAR